MPFLGGIFRRLQRVGLSAFHPWSIAVRLKDYDRLCDSQDVSIHILSPPFFIGGALGLSTWSLRSIPCILLSGLSSLKICARLSAMKSFDFCKFLGREAGFQCATYSIHDLFLLVQGWLVFFGAVNYTQNNRNCLGIHPSKLV